MVFVSFNKTVITRFWWYILYFLFYNGYRSLLLKSISHRFGTNISFSPAIRVFAGRITSIGSNVNLEDVFVNCHGNITIGDSCFFGHRVMLLGAKHDVSGFGGDRSTKIINQDITIDNGAWVASGAIILGGVHVGSNSVIGAGSVVTHDVPPNCLVVGNPAGVKRFINP